MSGYHFHYHLYLCSIRVQYTLVKPCQTIQNHIVFIISFHNYPFITHHCPANMVEKTLPFTPFSITKQNETSGLQNRRNKQLNGVGLLEGLENISLHSNTGSLDVPANSASLAKHQILPNQTQGRKRTKRIRPQNLVCHVCGDQAGGHSYYGGQACSSCRAFFRRAVESDYRFSYFCLVAGECKIDQRSRKKCQYCRYQACLAAGMKPGWVLKRENNEIMPDNKRKTKKTESVFKKPRPPPLLKSKNFINAEEKMEVNYLVKTSGHFDSSKIGGLGVELVREFVRYVKMSCINLFLNIADLLHFNIQSQNMAKHG